MKRLRVVTVAILAVTALSGIAAQRQPRFLVLAGEAARRVDITVDGKPFTSYIWPDSLKKPVLDPVFSANGAMVTRGYPLRPREGERTDHPHHAGIWFNHGDVNGFDFWNNSDDIKGDRVARMGTIHHRRIVETKNGDDRGELAVEAEWIDGTGTPIIREHTRFIFRGSSDARSIDRITTLTALAPKVLFRDNKEGTLGIRVARELEQPDPKSPDPRVSGLYTSSAGKTGDAVWGTRGPWTLLGGRIGSEPITIAILDHPSNPGYPTHWHARGYGLFAANPLGQKTLEDGDVEITLPLQRGESATFRYRILIQSMAPDTERIERESQAFAQEGSQMADVRLMTLDPGHFHAALIQKEMYPGVASSVDVYAPAGWDLDEHLKRVEAYNRRAEKRTSWKTEVHTGDDFLARMLRERPGNAVILSGRNRPKIDRIAQSVRAGLHVLADKPWILATKDLAALESVLADADQQGVVAYDIMTERFEITTILQRALVNDAGVFGEIIKGSESDPAVYMESVHHLMKVVSGAPNIRPSWFFDTVEQGEGFNDIGTHLVDLVQWTLFPEQAIQRSDVRVLSAQRWPTMVPETEFQRVTGGHRFDGRLAPFVKNGTLEYFANTLVSYAVRGVNTKLNIIWDWEAPPGGGDTHFAFYRGSRARIEIRQTAADKYLPELYVIPANQESRAGVLTATRKAIASLQQKYPGLTVEERGPEIHVIVPVTLREGHEAHFAQVAANFLRYVRDRRAMPAWERPNMVAKYYVTTTGTELSRQSPPRVAPRIAPK
jgi:predicted dehydrogenase